MRGFEADWKFVKQQGPDDCFRAAVATVLGLSLEEVPNFYGEGRTGAAVVEAIRTWAATHGLAPLIFSCTASLSELLAGTERLNPGVPFILSGLNVIGGHSVVCYGGKIVHDPCPMLGPNDGGVCQPFPTGFEVQYFVALPPWSLANAARFSTASQARSAVEGEAE